MATEICVIITNYFGKISGGDNHAIEVFRRFDTSKINVTWLCTESFRTQFTKELPISHRYCTLDVRYFRGRFGYLLFSVFAIPYSVIKLVKCKLRNNTLYSSSDTFNDVLVGYLAKVLFSSRWIAIAHMSLISRSDQVAGFLPRLNRLAQFGIYRLLKKADRVLVVDRTTGLDLQKCGVYSGKIVLSANGVASRRSIDLDKKCDVVFIASRWTSQKGVDDIEPIWEYLSKRMTPPSLVVIGVVPEKVISHFKSGKFGRYISFTGLVDENTKMKLIGSSKVLILPSRYESFSVVTIEALSCKTPVVRYDIDIPIDFGGVEKVPRYDVKAFAATLEHLLMDQNRYSKLRNSIYVPEQYYWNSISSRIERLIEEVDS